MQSHKGKKVHRCRHCNWYLTCTYLFTNVCTVKLHWPKHIMHIFYITFFTDTWLTKISYLCLIYTDTEYSLFYHWSATLNLQIQFFLPIYSLELSSCSLKWFWSWEIVQYESHVSNSRWEWERDLIRTNRGYDYLSRYGKLFDWWGNRSRFE